MSVQDGQPGNAATFNSKLASKQDDNTFLGVQDLDAPGSGAQVANAQLQINENKDNIATNSIDIATNQTNIAENATDISEIRTTQGTSDGDTDMGVYVAGPNTFNLTDNQSAKVNNQELIDGIDARQLLSEKGAANGYPELDGTGRIPVGQLPITSLIFKGNWDANSNTPTISDAGGAQNEYYRVSVSGTQDLGSGSIDFEQGDYVIHNGSIFENGDGPDIKTVNTKTGPDVVLDTDDISEGATNKYNKTHTGEVTGAEALTLDKTAITNKTEVVPEAGDFVLYSDTSDAGNLKKANIVDLLGTGGGGTGGINYLEGDSVDFETGVLGDWITYNDGAVSEPVDGTGGSPAGITLSAVNTGVIRGDWHALFSKDAANRQGQGFSIDFTIDDIDKNKILFISQDLIDSLGAINQEWLTFWVYDITAATMQRVIPKNGLTRFVATYNTSDNTDYRFIAHIATTDTTAFDYRFDNNIIGPDKILDVPIVSYLGKYTPTITNNSGGITNYTVEADQWRNGDNLVVKGNIDFTGTPAAFNGINIGLPGGLNIDTSKQASSNDANHGQSNVKFFDTGVNFFNGFAQQSGTDKVGLLVYNTAGTYAGSTFPTQAIPFTFTNPDSIYFEFEYPIAEWANQSAILSTKELLNSPGKAKFYLGSNQNITSSGTVPIEFDTTVYNDGGIFDLNVATGEITVNKTCKVDIKCAVRLINHIAENNVYSIRVNGNAIAAQSKIMTTSTNDHDMSTDLELNKGDIITVVVDSLTDTNYDSQGALTVTWVSISEVPDFTFLGIHGETEVVSSASGTVNVTWPFAATAFGDFTSVTLEPGEWDIWGTLVGYINTGVSTTTTFEVAITENPGNDASGISRGTNYSYQRFGTSDSFPSATINVLPSTVTVNQTTTYYLKGRVSQLTDVNYLGYNLTARRIK